jgi:hypothetical protein
MLDALNGDSLLRAEVRDMTVLLYGSSQTHLGT